MSAQATPDSRQGQASRCVNKLPFARLSRGQASPAAHPRSDRHSKACPPTGRDIRPKTTTPDEIIAYYNATRADYRRYWTGSRDGAIHFGFYDGIDKHHRRALLRMNEFLASCVALRPEDRVLDAGCGFGGSALWIADGIGASVAGITLVPHQAQHGRDSATKRSLSHLVSIQRADYTHLPFPEETFSVYWALESIVHATNRERVLEEAYRVLRPGGRIVIAEYTLREDPPLADFEETLKHEWLRGWTMPSLVTSRAFMAMLSAVGFYDIEHHDITENVRPSIKRLEFVCALVYPVAKTTAPLFMCRKRLDNYFGSRAQIKLLKSQGWRYSVFTARKAVAT